MLQNKPFDDAPQWYWGVTPLRTSNLMELAGNKFVVACGQQELWARVSREVEPGGCSWAAFGPPSGEVTLSHCMRVFIRMRESFGVNLNRLSFEMAQVPSFATFLREEPWEMRNWTSSPLSEAPLPREPWSHEAENRLRAIVGQTLKLPDEGWAA